jgi:UDP-N-acetylmuramyl pentapeptide phosphotransferase/UDP-N-acetylglucosamine-1-phosphate transferase
VAVAAAAAGALYFGDPVRIAAAAIVIALSANALNLLDLRPGRACAAFIVSSLILAGIVPAQAKPALWAIIPTGFAYPLDATARVMLGDTGSNLLGGLLGVSLVLAIPSVAGLLAALAVLAAFHAAAERWSLSEIIERNSILRKLDSLTGAR